MKSLGLSYFLCILQFFIGISGIHRFYLEKPISGILYLMTWGFFGIGTIVDLINMPKIVDKINIKYLKKNNLEKLPSDERKILEIAKKHGGTITIQMVSLESNMSLNKSKFELEKLKMNNFCTKDIDEDGVEIYFFNGFKAKNSILG